MYNYMLAFVFCAICYIAGEYVSNATKAWVPSVFVTAALMLVGYWTVFPNSLVADSNLIPFGSSIAMYLIVTHMGTVISFKQLFAQVTNPPIDALREKVVTSTTVYVGAQGNLLEEAADNCKVLKIDNPILTETDIFRIKSMDVPGLKVETISICYYQNTDLE